MHLFYIAKSETECLLSACILKQDPNMKRLNWVQARSREGRWAGPHKEVSLEEIKSREVELGLRVGLLLLQLFPSGGATDIVFVTLFHIAVGTAIAWCGGRCAMPDGHCRNILLFWRQSMAALVFWIDACFEVSLFCPPFPTHPRP